MVQEMTYHIFGAKPIIWTSYDDLSIGPLEISCGEIYNKIQ